MKVSWKKYSLKFKFEAGTSRGILKRKISYFIIIQDEVGNTGIGECSLLPGLSMDDRPDYEKWLDAACAKVQNSQISNLEILNLLLDESIGNSWPSIRMGLETAFLDYFHNGGKVIYLNDFLNGEGIPINGLIWMGDKDFMLEQVKRKINDGYSCIKMKIGAIDFKTELEILKNIRTQFSVEDMTLRVDANGAFSAENVMNKLVQLEKLKIHSIEQPLKSGQWEHMYNLCRETPVPIGLDEELIGNYTFSQKQNLLQAIKPQYLILKPSLLGGFSATKEWINIAESSGTGWWITSALESNIGLNAICQYTYGFEVSIEQGLGTGQLFENNIDSPLEVKNGFIKYNTRHRWDLSVLGIEGIQ